MTKPHAPQIETLICLNCLKSKYKPDFTTFQNNKFYYFTGQTEKSISIHELQPSNQQHFITLHITYTNQTF